MNMLNESQSEPTGRHFTFIWEFIFTSSSPCSSILVTCGLHFRWEIQVMQITAKQNILFHCGVYRHEHWVSLWVQVTVLLQDESFYSKMHIGGCNMSLKSQSFLLRQTGRVTVDSVQCRHPTPEWNIPPQCFNVGSIHRGSFSVL